MVIAPKPKQQRLKLKPRFARPVPQPLLPRTLLLRKKAQKKLAVSALAAATIGGLDSPRGAIVGGFIVGITQSLAPGYLGIPTELTLLPPLAAMVFTLLVRPHGIFGTAPVARV